MHRRKAETWPERRSTKIWELGLGLCNSTRDQTKLFLSLIESKVRAGFTQVEHLVQIMILWLIGFRKFQETIYRGYPAPNEISPPKYAVPWTYGLCGLQYKQYLSGCNIGAALITLWSNTTFPGSMVIGSWILRVFRMYTKLDGSSLHTFAPWASDVPGPDCGLV